VKVVERPRSRSGLREPFAANTGAATGARRTATLEVRRSDKIATAAWRRRAGELFQGRGRAGAFTST
jgi:hypothetical protein